MNPFPNTPTTRPLQLMMSVLAAQFATFAAPSTLTSQPSTLNPQPSTLNPQPSTLAPQPSTLSPIHPTHQPAEAVEVNPSPNPPIPHPVQLVMSVLAAQFAHSLHEANKHRLLSVYYYTR